MKSLVFSLAGLLPAGSPIGWPEEVLEIALCEKEICGIFTGLVSSNPGSSLPGLLPGVSLRMPRKKTSK